MIRTAFTLKKLMKIFRVPSWFSFTDTVGKIRSYEMIGQSVDGGMFQAIANRIAEVFFMNKTKRTSKTNTLNMQINSKEQLGFIF